MDGMPKGIEDDAAFDIVRVSWNLTPDEVLAAYRRGEFPMGGHRVITWHRPRTRAVFPLDGFRVSQSLARTLRRANYLVTFDTAFDHVMLGCAARDETWIDDRILAAYSELHRRGHAHSVEVWLEGELAAGVYGVQIGGAFFAESMFHRVRDMSKVGLHALAGRLLERGFELFEVQYVTPHLASLGAVEIPGEQYRRRLAKALTLDCRFPD